MEAKSILLKSNQTWSESTLTPLEMNPNIHKIDCIHVHALVTL